MEPSRASNKVVITKSERCVGDPRGQWLWRTASSSCSSETEEGEVGMWKADGMPVGVRRCGLDCSWRRDKYKQC